MAWTVRNSFPIHPAFDQTPTLSTILQARREFVARELLDVCRRYAKPRILSIANGVLREAEPVFQICHDRGGEFVAVDQDCGALNLVCREYEQQSVRKMQSYVPCLPAGLEQNEFHYIYALNIFAELDGRAAADLLRRLFGKLKRGGSVLITSFTARCTEPEMAKLALSIPGQTQGRARDLARRHTTQSSTWKSRNKQRSSYCHCDCWCSLSVFNSTVGVTDIPGKSRWSRFSPGSRMIFTGIRCTTLT